MTCNIVLLRGKIAEKGISSQQLSEKLGISPRTFTRKMNPESLAFKVGQMHQINTFPSINAK